MENVGKMKNAGQYRDLEGAVQTKTPLGLSKRAVDILLKGQSFEGLLCKWHLATLMFLKMLCFAVRWHTH